MRYRNAQRLESGCCSSSCECLVAIGSNCASDVGSRALRHQRNSVSIGSLEPPLALCTYIKGDGQPHCSGSRHLVVTDIIVVTIGFDVVTQQLAVMPACSHFWPCRRLYRTYSCI